MKLESGNLPRLAGNNFRLTSILMLSVIAYVSILGIVDSTKHLGNLTAQSLSFTNSQDSSTATATPEVGQGTYVPPNYGAPNSQRGSGTR